MKNTLIALTLIILAILFLFGLKHQSQKMLPEVQQVLARTNEHDWDGYSVLDRGAEEIFAYEWTSNHDSVVLTTSRIPIITTNQNRYTITFK